MYDSYSRRIDCLRVSVTDRCNLRCRYCMPARGVAPLDRSELLAEEELVAVVAAAARAGIGRIRLTGGEPLLREGIVALVARTARTRGIHDLSMTTNGLLLAGVARELAAAGLRRVNVSLDAVDPERYRAITRGGDVGRVLAGIEAARAAGLWPIKLNCVVERSSGEPDARAVAGYGHSRGLEVRFIRRMDLASGAFWPVEGGDGGVCARCSRLRLSCDGLVRPCLFSDLRFSVRELGPDEAIRRAVLSKPKAGTSAPGGRFHAIGG